MAGRRIAGITIEIGADSTNFQKALKSIDSNLRTTQSNLKDINKLLKLDPGNTELLTQKQEQLTTAIDQTKERLETLKQVTKDSVSAEQYDAVQREIIATEQDLKSLETEYKNFGSVSAQQIQAVGSAVQKAGEKISGVGTALSTYVTAPIVAIGAAAYAAFTDVDEGLDTIIKKTGLTGDALDGMEIILENLVTSIPTDFRTAGEAIGEVNTRFGYTGTQLEELSKKYIKFAELNDTDVTSAITNTRSAMEAMNYDMADMGLYLDLLTYVSQQTGVSVDALTSGVTKNAAAFTELGTPMENAVWFIGQIEKNGGDTSTVMNGLSKALKNCTDKGIPLNEAFADLQKTILEDEEGTKGLAAAYDLFGKSGADIYQLVRNGTIDLNDLTTGTVNSGVAFENYKNTVSDTFDAIQDPADQFKIVINELKLLGNDIAEVAMPAIQAAIEKVRDVVEKLREKWNGLSEEQKGFILNIVGVAAAIGPLLLAGGKLVTGIGKTIKLVGTIKTAIDGAGGLISILTGPAGIVVAIGAIIAIGYELITHWDEVKAKAKEIWEKVSGFATDAWNKIKAINWVQLGKDIWTNITSAFASIKTWATEKFNEAVNAIKSIDWAGVGLALWNGIKEGVNGLGSAAGAVGTWFLQVFADAWDKVKSINWAGVGYAIWTAIKDAFTGFADWFISVFKKPINAVIRMVNAMIGGVEGAINNVITGINRHLTIDISFGNNPFTGRSLGGLYWSPNLSTVSWGRLQELASGGVLEEGMRAIVGEHAPEYLRVLNGRAVVTPLDNTNAESRYGGTTNNVINVYAQPGQSATQIAEEVQRIMVQQQRQREAAYA